jgi:hypothetical protein
MIDLPQKSKQSANGAEYESQGQARSEAERDTPGYREHTVSRPEGPKLPRQLRPFRAGNF